MHQSTFRRGILGAAPCVLPSAFSAMANRDPTWNMDTDNNCTVEFDAFGFSVKDFLTRHILLRCDSSGDLYPVTSPSPTPHALLSMSPKKSSHLCHACQLGKHVRLPFTSSDSIITRSFEIVHSDIWTSPIASSDGFKYYVLFLDHYLWIYPLRTKSEVFQKFLHFCSYVNNQFKCDIAAFQCDHGGEFDNTNLLNLFAQNGIQVRFSCPKTSQQNGKSERMIRTINNVIRTLLFQAHLPPTFWVEALHMAAYLLNLLPSSAIQNEIPCTKLFNKQPDYSRLRIFGCLCYPHLHSPHKLAPRATPCIFLGYPAYHRGYRCLDLSTNKIIISRHVTFDELQFPYGSITPLQPTSYTFLDPTPSLIHQHIIHNTTQHPTTPHAPITPMLDVKNAFLNGDLSETVYMYQPPGYANRVGFSSSRCDSSLFIYQHGSEVAHLLIYVGDIVLTASSMNLLQHIISSLHKEFDMTDLGALNYFLGISVTRDSRGMFLSQNKYALELLDRDHMANYNPTRMLVDIESKLGSNRDPISDPTLYHSLAGGLQYLTFTHPDISYAVQRVCLHMHDPREPHLEALKIVLRYVRDTLDFGLQLYASITDNLLSWSAKQQHTLSRSSAEAEYRGVANVDAETALLRNILRELHTPLLSATLVYCDNVRVLHVPSHY
ncbi:ribonuclease H-like domain-containing protein [Tanacetum coccineum]